VGHVARMGEMRNALSILRKRPLGKPRHRWDGNIKTDINTVCGRGLASSGS